MEKNCFGQTKKITRPDKTGFFIWLAASKPEQRKDDLAEGQLNHFIVITLYQQQPISSIKFFYKTLNKSVIGL